MKIVRHVFIIVSLLSVSACLAQSDAILSYEVRDWTDKTGTHNVRAKLIDIVGGNVRLKKTDGTIVSLPLDRLSVPDQAYCISLKKRVEGELEGLLKEGLQNDLEKTSELVSNLLNEIAEFKNKQREIIESDDTSASKREKLGKVASKMGDVVARLPKRQLFFHAQILDLESSGGSQKSRQKFVLKVKIIDFPGRENAAIAIVGSGDDGLIRTFKNGAFVKVRCSFHKSPSAFSSFSVAQYNTNPSEVEEIERSRDDRGLITIPVFISAVNLVSDEDAAVLGLK